MKVKFTLALLLGALVVFTSVAHAGTITRSGSGYGSDITSGDFTPITGVTESYVCVGTTDITPADGCESEDNTSDSGHNYDLIVQITGSTYVGDALQLTLPELASSSLSGSSPIFGLLQCEESFPTAGLNPLLCGTPSTPTPSADCGSEFPTSAVSGIITLPGSCVVVGATFYFDETATSDSDLEKMTGAPVGITPVVPTSAPESSSLSLLGIGLASLALLSRRRLQA
jgi:hypothetical protein